MNLKDHHVLHYLVLIVGLMIFSYFFVYFRYQSLYQSFTVTAGAIFYFLWGVVHHYVEDRLTKTVAMEYLAISAFVSVLVFVVLNL